MEVGPVESSGLLAAIDVKCDCRECDNTDPHCVPHVSFSSFQALILYGAGTNDREEVITVHRATSRHPFGSAVINQ